MASRLVDEQSRGEGARLTDKGRREGRRGSPTEGAGEGPCGSPVERAGNRGMGASVAKDDAPAKEATPLRRRRTPGLPCRRLGDEGRTVAPPPLPRRPMGPLLLRHRRLATGPLSSVLLCCRGLVVAPLSSAPLLHRR
jgi:hypothetical protein